MMGGDCEKRTAVRFFNGFNDIVLIHRPSVQKATINQMFFEIFQTQNCFELLPDSAQILHRRLLIHHNRPKTEIHLKKIAEQDRLPAYQAHTWR
jgi:hypothetical protein